MKNRPLLWAFLAVLSGEVMAILVPGRWSFIACVPALAAALIIIIKGQKKAYLLLPFLFVLGAAAMLRAGWISELEAHVDELSEVRAVVDDIRMTSDGGYRMEAGEVLIYSDEKPEAIPGDRVVITGSFEAFEHASNPGQFDAYDYYHAKGLAVLGDDVSVSVYGHAFRPLAGAAYLIRQRLVWACDVMASSWSANERWAEDIDIIKGMFLGEKSLIPSEVRDLFSTAGIAHMLAVSGLHIGIIGMRTFRFLKKKMLLPYKYAAPASSAIVLFYCMLCGFSASSVRALAMFSVMIAGEAYGKQYDLMTAMSAAGIVTCLMWPLQITQAAFQISYLAVAGMGLVCPVIADFIKPRGMKRSELFNSLVGIVGIQLSTFPAVVWHYYRFSVSGMALNLFVIPALPVMALASFAAVFASLFSGPAGTVIFMPVYFLLELIRAICTAVNKVPFADILLGRPSAVQVTAYAVFLVYVLAVMKHFKDPERLKKRFRWGICLAVLAAGIVFVRHLPSGDLEVYFLDVGQGDGIFIRFPSGDTAFIDGGSSSVSSVGEYRLIPFLDYMGVETADMAFISHMDDDHMNGIQEVIEAGRVGSVFLSCVGSADKEEDRSELLELTDEAGTDVSYLSRGDEWSDGTGVTLTCVYPEAGDTVESDDENDASAVLLLRYGDVSVLFTGDITSEREPELSEGLEEAGFEGPLTVLKAAHHGSRYSTCEDFLSSINPRLAVLSYGVNNRYGHPSDETVLRLENAGVSIVRTPDGCIRMTADEEGSVRIEIWQDGKYT